MYIDDKVLKKIDTKINYCFEVFEPEYTEIVLGRSCKEEEDIFIENCLSDGISILRRLGGGGTVLLTKGVVVISVAGKSKVQYRLREHMESVNELIIKFLETKGVKNLRKAGISDIALKERKVLGSSLYRKKDLVLYQGSLLVNPDLTLFEKYLLNPKRQPDYRKGRNHLQFCTSLWEEGYKLDKKLIIKELSYLLKNGPPWQKL